MNVTVITYKDQDIEILVDKNEVQWSINRNGLKYANAVLLPSEEMHDLIGAIGTIIINAIRTIEELDRLSIEESNKQTEQKADNSKVKKDKRVKKEVRPLKKAKGKITK